MLARPRRRLIGSLSNTFERYNSSGPLPPVTHRVEPNQIEITSVLLDKVQAER
jgi:hypothetical protein